MTDPTTHAASSTHATHATPVGPVTHSFGPLRQSDGQTRFRFWAPSVAERGAAPALCLDGQPPIRMQPAQPADGEPGWFTVDADAPAGTRYRFEIPAEDGASTPMAVPDPASRQQDGDVHDASIVTDDAAYAWQHADWRGRPWHEAVLYELHPGLFGGFQGITAQLPALAELGITAVELMPIADFPGTRNWGYDGVLPYAPDAAYGTPDDLKTLIDTAHGLGLMVFLDVVYNHFGPDGNYLHAYAGRFFREDIHTPWGAAIDYRQPAVRRFFTENAIHWVQDFRFDGLRFDAVHAISDPDWLDEMAREVRAAVGPDRHVHLVLEHDGNAARHLGQPFDAQWNDDAHHLLHVLLAGEDVGYYADYADRPAEKLARWLSEGFIYQGDPSPYRDGEPRGEPSAHLPPTAFVNCLQNHDQIGNRALGERLTLLAPQSAVCAGAALLLLCPQIPMLFMGEETGATEPFLYFTDHGGDLAKLVHEGRQKEFAQFPAFADPEARDRIPNPNDASTYDASRPAALPAAADLAPEAAGWRAYYQRLLHLRATALMPVLHGAVSLGAEAIGPTAVRARWRLGDGSELGIWTNLGSAAAVLQPADAVDGAARDALFCVPDGAAAALESQGHLPPWSTVVTRTGAQPSAVPAAFTSGTAAPAGSKAHG